MGHKIIQSKTIESRTDFFYYAFRNILLVGLPLVLISGFILSLPHSSATSSGSTSSSDHVYFTLSTSCTMSGELISPHTVEIHGGQYKTNVGTTKLNTYCNDGNGYSIYAIGSSNNTDGNNYLINSDNNNYNISTGIYDSSTATVNTPSSWSMKLTSGTGTGNTLTPPTIVNGYDDYSEIPNVYTQVAKRTSETEMNTNTDITGSYLTTTYAIYTSSYQPAGSYSGNVKYVMIHPSSNINTITGSFNMAFFKAGKQPAYQDGSGNSYFAMQDMTSDICASVSGDGESTATQLVDIRDNKLYWVTKLKDEHCWMTQNLDLDLSHEVALTSETSDIDSDTYNTGIYTEFTGYSKNETTGVVSWLPSTIENNAQQADTKSMTWSRYTTATVSGWTNNSNSPYSADAGDRYMYTDASGNEAVYTSLEACEIGTNDDIAGCEHIHLGNYYNWSAAVASNNTASASGNQTNSICPKNWDLPTTGKYGTMLQSQSVWTGDANNTYDTDGYLKIRTAPLYFLQSGRIQNGTLSSFGTYSRYWSSMVNTTAYFISFDAYGVYPNGTNGNRGYGFSVRCVAR